MLLLGIDTSGKSGGVTLAQKDSGPFRVLASSPIEGGTFSAQLIPTIERLLQAHQLNIRQVDGFAVASGPGSFTGLRVGLSAVKALSEALEKPIAAVSVLEAIAASVVWAGNESDSHPVCRVALDASRNETFFGEYECLHPVAPKILCESLITLSDLAERVERWGHGAHLVTSDAAIVEGLKNLVHDPFLVNVDIVSRPTSEDIARVGASKLLAGDTVSLEALDANYLRRSDAEIFFKG